MENYLTKLDRRSQWGRIHFSGSRRNAQGVPHLPRRAALISLRDSLKHCAVSHWDPAHGARELSLEKIGDHCVCATQACLRRDELGGPDLMPLTGAGSKRPMN
jgi:hypothetical protein